MTHLDALAKGMDWIFEVCKPGEKEVDQMDRFSIALDSEYREEWNACRKCGEEDCECPQPCHFDPNIAKCSKAYECTSVCWEEEEE